MDRIRTLISSRLLAGALPVVAIGLVAGFLGIQRSAAEGAVSIPKPAIDEPAGDQPEVAVFAGGCFWGVQAVFEHVKGVISAVDGYAGGTVPNPTYEQVGGEQTGHAESVQVTFDPKQVSYGTLLHVLFSVVMDPTEKDFQGPDHGSSYRSAIFTTSDAQKKVADAYVAELDAAKVFPAPIVTEVTPYTNFYRAEDYHQDNGITLKVNAGYVEFNDVPKVNDLKSLFPELWQEKPKTVFPENAAA
jgi:peptide-methionine (S)-S-oxide reductase